MREFVIPIKVHDAELPFPEHKSWGDWVDLRAAETVEMKQGEFRIISLGVSMRLPNGYEANVVPRSSTFKNFGVLMANSFGVIDNNYCGNDDVVQRQPKLVFAKVDDLNSKNRGGFGSTGIK